MAGRREVNVGRPEHSWIPFYRELAEKLVTDGWRERQGELVGMLQRMQANGVPMPRVVEFMKDSIDPFTVFALFSRDLRFDNTLRVMQRFKDEFNLAAELPRKRPFIPYADNRSVGYFSRFVGIDSEIDVMWELFEVVVTPEDFDDVAGNASLIRLINKGLRIRGIAISKLTSAFYWVNPHLFLHSDTVNAVGGKSLGIKATDGESYLKALERTREITSQAFPDTNVAVWKGEQVTWLDDGSGRPDVWIMRGGRDAHAVASFLERGYAGIGFNLENDDLSVLSSADEIRDLYQERNPRGTASNQVVDFRLKVKPGDYVLMPGEGSKFNHFGRFTTNVFNDATGPYKNKRSVDWDERTISRDEIDLSNYQRTVVHPNSGVRDRFFEIIKDMPVVERRVARSIFSMPEDSWVPFHLEVGRKLVEGEWWLEGKRKAFQDMIDNIRWTDPWESPADRDQHVKWSPDPYSFFLAFNMQKDDSMRVSAFEKVKECLDIATDLPTELSQDFAWGGHSPWERPLDREESSLIWEFLVLAIRFEPQADTLELTSKFIELYDRLVSSSFLPGYSSRFFSYFLYWIDPTKYVQIRRLGTNELGLAEDLGVTLNRMSGENYMQALKGLHELGNEYGFTVLDVNRKSTTREMLGLDSIEEPTIKAYTIDDLVNDDDLFFEPGELRRIHSRFEDKKNLILQGPPGVGKTFVLRRLAYALMGEQVDDRIRNVQFHQSYSYEEFVQGYRPDTNCNDQLIFELKDGTFKELCDEARDNSDDRYVMVIDEINRGNLSRVFGELLSLIEKDKRGGKFRVRLAGGNEFSVPENVYILGTMNLADRSLAGMDYAMRRRFAFVTLEPQFEKGVFVRWLRDKGVPEGMIHRINEKMKALNEVIANDPSLGRNFAVGHSYFCDIADGGESDWDRWYREIVETEIQPLLEEYWFDNLGKADEEVEKLLDGVPENGESNDNRS